ncbi:MAG: hypothetical protein APF84_08390 [Gracilibacter sp. BRH_c7a]|nr:MAG: hypothetical protein APF84_08390 [Gracilibacter sp. BRH_c7a]
MRYVRFETRAGEKKYGVLSDDKIKVIQGSIFEDHSITEEAYPLYTVKLLAPVEPTKILCIGLNYVDHAKEFGKPVPDEPLLFLKPSTSVIGPEEKIIYPPQTQNLHYEVELAIVIGRTAKNIKRAEALEYVFGYTVGNDITARDLQSTDSQWSRAKGFDTFCPLGPWIETEINNQDNLDIKLYLNGEVKQNSNTNNLAFKCADLIEYLSAIMTLLPGDVILTGTPGGIGSMQPGDKVEAYVEKIGTLTNTIALP